MLKPFFSRYKNFVFDLDGTVWKWTNLVDNAKLVFEQLERDNKNCYFLTNNTLLTREGFRKKLERFEINADYEQIINPSIPAIEILKGKHVLCIGEGLTRELKRAKINFSSKPDAVIVSESRKFTYDTLSEACIAVESGAKFYKTAKGGAFIYGDKRLPGTGAIAAVIEETTGKKAENIGKPSRYMVKTMKSLGLEPERTVIFGDEADSDIVFGKKLGFTTVLVLTGRDAKQYGKIKPDIILNSIAEIINR